MKVYINLLVLPALALAAAVNLRSPDVAGDLAAPGAVPDAASPDAVPEVASPDAAAAAPQVASPDAAAAAPAVPDVASPDAAPAVPDVASPDAAAPAAPDVASPDVATPTTGDDLATPVTPLVQMVTASPIDGKACPSGNFGRFIDAKQVNTTLIFDKFAAYMGNKASDEQRERFCNYQIVLRFPTGCSSATIHITPRGSLRLTDNSFSAFFSQITTIDLGSPGTQTTNFTGQGPEFVSTTGDKEFIKFGQYTVSQTNLLANQRDVNMKIQMRVSLQDAGKKDDNSFGLDSLDVSITDAKKC